jgi:biotin transport system substrate-specific component
MINEKTINKNVLLTKKVIFLIPVIIFSTFIITLSAKLKVPFYPVPMTMQPFVIVLIGAMFGWRLGSTIVLIYVLEGALGLPVFAGTPEKGIGLSYILGPTFGYILGFVFSALIAGYLNFKVNFLKRILLASICIAPIYILGMIWLGSIIGWDKPIFELGAKPFLFAELFKVLLIATILPLVLKLKNKFKRFI